MPVASTLLIPAVPLAIIVQLFRLPRYWRAHRWRGFLPLMTCVFAVPCGAKAGRAMLEGWFSLNSTHYESVASAVRKGVYTPDDWDRLLGFAGHPIQRNDQLTAVEFMLARPSRYFCTKYVRIYDEEGFRPRGKQLAANWYLVDDFCFPNQMR
jgi:hypothetical protein